MKRRSQLLSAALISAIAMGVEYFPVSSQINPIERSQRNRASDEERMRAADEKRARKAAKRIAQKGGE